MSVGNVHTNGIHNFWSLFKRALKDTYVSAEPAHFSAYVSDQTFRFNERRMNNGCRFPRVLGAVGGRRLTYKQLTAHAVA